MSDKVVVIIGTGESEKARTGAMYAINALKHGWMEEVKLIFFGPGEKLLLEDEVLQAFVRDYQAMEETVIACKFIADRDGLDEGISQLGVQVIYVGQLISDLIKEGYTPMVW